MNVEELTQKLVAIDTDLKVVLNDTNKALTDNQKDSVETLTDIPEAVNGFLMGNVYDKLAYMALDGSITDTSITINIPPLVTSLDYLIGSDSGAYWKNLTECTVKKTSGADITVLYRMCYRNRVLQVLNLEIDTSKVEDFSAMFSCSSTGGGVIKTINGTFDFSSATSVGNMFSSQFRLENITFAKETLNLSITFPMSTLTTESVQSIIDGLATVETTQTLTLNPVILEKLTTDQYAIISAKNWTVE